MPTQIEPLPNDAPMVDAQTRRITPVWYRYLSVAIVGRLQASAFVTKAVTRTGQAAAIGATPIAQGSAGLYRVSWNLRVTQPATTSSSLTVTIANTDGGINVVQSGPALTGNSLITLQSGLVLVRADAATAITYAVAYTSVGATPLQYAISVVAEQAN
jgi:hypothetical protein